jgi:hypothetical protein
MLVSRLLDWQYSEWQDKYLDYNKLRTVLFAIRNDERASRDSAIVAESEAETKLEQENLAKKVDSADLFPKIVGELKGNHSEFFSILKQEFEKIDVFCLKEEE